MLKQSPLLRLAHCSDIHLGSDSHDISIYRQRFAQILSNIRQKRPHLLLLAGDLFDANNVSDETVFWAMDRLAAQPYPIAIIPGNHDCLESNGIYRRYDFNRIHNVEMFSAPQGEVRFIDSLDLAIWGKAMVEHCPAFRPLADSPLRPRTHRWYVGMGHGFYVPLGQTTDRSSPIPHQDIMQAPFDYLALGHHHAALTLETENGMAAFCGSPTDTLGAGPTYIIAELSLKGTQIALHTVEDI